MNRTQRAKIRAAHQNLEMNRMFKNDALYVRKWSNSMYPGSDRFEDELKTFKGAQKNLRKLKKYHGPSGLMTENYYMELMGA